MNRILVIVVIVLFPIAVFSDNSSSEEFIESNSNYVEKFQDLNLTNFEEVVSKKEKVEEKPATVLVSNNNDKSEALEINLEEYVIGVVAGEMPASFNLEALKAQAVAARTYALYKMKNIPGYVLSDTINDQVYLNKEKMMSKWGDDYSYYYNRVKEAVDKTRGEVLTYNGDIIISYYFAISNGYTENVENVFGENKDYLVSVESEWDKKYQSYSSTASISRETFCNKLSINCDNINISNVKRGNNHYVREITINNETFSGIQIFNKLNLKSTDFTININGNEVVIKTYGFGHSVGMSQYGAQGMASGGYKYSDILKHYYQKTEISKI